MWSSAVFVDPDSLKHSFLYVHLGVGLQDFLLSRSHAIDQFLASQKIVHEFTPTPGTHSWMVWRGYLVDFLTKFSAVAR